MMAGFQGAPGKKGGNVEGIVDRLRYLVAEKMDLSIRLEEIDPDAELMDGGLMLDSLALVKLIGLSEREFQIEFGEDDLLMESFASLRALAGVIAVHRSFQQSEPRTAAA
jgi:acyl carrier protein